jgi:hypothetical protein
VQPIPSAIVSSSQICTTFRTVPLSVLTVWLFRFLLETPYGTVLAHTMAVELPIEITVIVNVKVGQPFSNSRSTYGSPFETRLIVSEGYDVFRQKILRHLSQLNEVRWEEHSPILYRPVSNAPQSKFEPLATEDADFQHQLQRVWRLAGRRRDGYGTYCVLR